MAEKEILTRIQHKYDTQINWEKATGFTPKKGEIIIYSDIKKFKVGDGNSKLPALQFYDIDLSSYATKAYADQAEADALAAAKAYVNGLASNIQTQLDEKQAKHSAITVTLSASNWSGNSQTVTATGVTASNTVFTTPAPASHSLYSESGVYCSAQYSGKLTFTCTQAPTSNLTVNIMILN